MRLPDPSPVLNKNRAPMGPEILSSTGAGVCRKAPVAFPDSSSVLDKFQSAIEGDGADRAAVNGLIRQGFARVGLEADQPDRDRVSSDRGFLVGQSGCDQSDQGHLRPKFDPNFALGN